MDDIKNSQKGTTRRDFLKTMGGGALALSLTALPHRRAFGSSAEQNLVAAYDASDALGWDPMAQALPTPDKTIASSLYNGLSIA